MEQALNRIARDRDEDPEIVELAVQIYFLHIRLWIDGKEEAEQKLDRFLDGKDIKIDTKVRRWVAPLVATAVALCAKLLVP